MAILPILISREKITKRFKQPVVWISINEATFANLTTESTIRNYLQTPVVFWHTPFTQSSHFFVHDIFIFVPLVIVGSLFCVLYRNLLSPQGCSHFSPVQSVLHVQNPDSISQKDVVVVLHLHVFWQLSP